MAAFGPHPIVKRCCKISSTKHIATPFYVWASRLVMVAETAGRTAPYPIVDTCSEIGTKLRRDMGELILAWITSNHRANGKARREPLGEERDVIDIRDVRSKVQTKDDGDQPSALPQIDFAA